MGSASEDIEAALHAMTLPEGFDWRLNGQRAPLPHGLDVIGGLVVSTGLTLLIISVVYSLLDRSR